MLILLHQGIETPNEKSKLFDIVTSRFLILGLLRFDIVTHLMINHFLILLTKGSEIPYEELILLVRSTL